jgi:hypothetical protein
MQGKTLTVLNTVKVETGEEATEDWS